MMMPHLFEFFPYLTCAFAVDYFLLTSGKNLSYSSSNYKKKLVKSNECSWKRMENTCSTPKTLPVQPLLRYSFMLLFQPFFLYLFIQYVAGAMSGHGRAIMPPKRYYYWKEIFFRFNYKIIIKV